MEKNNSKIYFLEIVKNTLIKDNYDRNYIYIILIFILSRIIYIFFFNITFDSWTIESYWQFMPLDLIKYDLFNSLTYNFAQPPLLNLMLGLLVKFSANFEFYLQLIYLAAGLASFLFFYKILSKIKINKTISFVLTSILMVLPTTILYENHFYKDYLTMCFLILCLNFSIDVFSRGKTLDYIYFSIFLVLLALLRETFHIFWIYLFLAFEYLTNKKIKKTLIIFVIINIFVLPFYLKNYFLFNHFGIAIMYENLSQKVQYIRDMKFEKNKKLKKIIFKDDKEYQKLTNSLSILFERGLFLKPEEYKEITNYKYRYNNKLLSSNTFFNEVHLKIDEIRKNDIKIILSNYPQVFLFSVANSAIRHFFRSSDHFYFVKINSQKIPKLIKLTDCLKLTLNCFYNFNFEMESVFTNNIEWKKPIYEKLSLKEKWLFSLQDTNFTIVIIYLLFLFYFCISLKNKNKTNIQKLMIFWSTTFIFIFLILSIFEDGEIRRHRFPFDYIVLLFLLFFNKLKKTIT